MSDSTTLAIQPATPLDLQVIADFLATAAWSAVERHPCFVPDADGLPATRLTGEEDAEYVARFNREFMPLIAMWQAAREAVVAAWSLETTGLIDGNTYRSLVLELLATYTPEQLAEFRPL